MALYHIWQFSRVLWRRHQHVGNRHNKQRRPNRPFSVLANLYLHFGSRGWGHNSYCPGYSFHHVCAPSNRTRVTDLSQNCMEKRIRSFLPLLFLSSQHDIAHLSRFLRVLVLLLRSLLRVNSQSIRWELVVVWKAKTKCENRVGVANVVRGYGWATAIRHNH